MTKPQTDKSTTANHAADKADDPDDPSTGFMFDQLCGVASHNPGRMSNRVKTHISPLAHHIFDGNWVPCSSQPHPMLTVTLTPCPEDHTTLGHPMTSTKSLRHTSVPIVADSGCQSCIMPTLHARELGISDADIIPVKLMMQGAIQEDLGVQGAIVADISTQDTSGSVRCTKQLIYLSNKMEKAFLCREALVGLGTLPAHFPTIPAGTAHAITAGVNDEESWCSCPKRPHEPPPLPTSFPAGLHATPENVPALKQWILDYYGASTFNTCEHQ